MAYGGWGGGQRRKPNPRPQHGPAHELNTRFEDIMRETRNLSKQYKTIGSELSRDTILFDTDPARQAIPVPQAAMILKQCGIPLSHEQYPPICKFNSTFPDSSYYLAWCGPVSWEHDDRFRYIPGYTRYVIDKFGRVINAFNGTVVQPEKGGFGYRLVGDGPASFNNPFYVQKDMLLALAWTPLPEGFVDYGMGTYSHVLGFDEKTQTYGWHARPQIKVRDRRTNETRLYRNLPEFIECAVEDFAQKSSYREYVRKGMTNEAIGIGDFDVKLAEEMEEAGPLPRINVGEDAGRTSTPSYGGQEDYADNSGNGADADVDFDSLDF